MDFFKELLLLYEQMPKSAMYNLVNQNSPYGNFMDECKNCYMVANAYNNEDCFYGRDIYRSKNCVDCDHTHDNELLYECLDCRHCYNSNFLQDCEECTDGEYLFDCRGCRNCFGCVGLRRAEFYIFNQKVPREEYASRILEWKKKGHKAIWEEFEKLKEKIPRLFSRQINVENVFGDYIKNSKNVWNSYGVQESWDIFHSQEIDRGFDCGDISFGGYSELCYECYSVWRQKNANFCTMCWESSDLEYCANVYRSRHCFGCVFLNHREFYILNKPYEREAYFKKLTEIKEQLKQEGTYGKWFWPPTYPIEDTVAVWERL